MSPTEIVDVILHGTLAREEERLMLLRLLRDLPRAVPAAG